MRKAPTIARQPRHYTTEGQFFGIPLIRDRIGNGDRLRPEAQAMTCNAYRNLANNRSSAKTLVVLLPSPLAAGA